ncbi:MAG: MFS transporter [Microcella sp.]|nr:MFS transporter [Microcella sp.]
MSTTSPDPTAAVVEHTERVRIEGPLRSLLLWFMPGVPGIFILWGAMFGGLALIALGLSSSIPGAYLVLASLSVVLLTIFAVFTGPRENRDEPRSAFRLRDFALTFWVNPIAHRDFFWAFTGRLLLYTGYFLVVAYQRYLLQDYIGLGAEAVTRLPFVSAAALPTLVLAVAISGPWSDRVGRRKPFVVASSLIVSLAQAVPWVWPTFEGMIVFALLAGLGFGAFQAIDTALVSQVLPDSHAHAKDLGVVNIAATLPQMVAPALAGVVVLSFGFAGLFPAAIALSVLGALAVLPIRSVR